MKVWTTTKFKGHWPVGSAAVVVAWTAEQAALLLNDELRERGLPPTEAKFMEPMNLIDGTVRILNDGNY